MTENPIIWQPNPEKLKKTAMYRFMKERSFDTYDDLYQWSIDNTADFWQALCDFCEVRFSKAADTILVQPGDMTTAKWFSGSELSFAEHVLRYGGDRAAIIFQGENGSRRDLSFDELRQAVAEIAQGLRSAGVVKGDRVAGYMPN